MCSFCSSVCFYGLLDGWAVTFSSLDVRVVNVFRTTALLWLNIKIFIYLPIQNRRCQLMIYNHLWFFVFHFLLLTGLFWLSYFIFTFKNFFIVFLWIVHIRHMFWWPLNNLMLAILVQVVEVGLLQIIFVSTHFRRSLTNFWCHLFPMIMIMLFTFHNSVCYFNLLLNQILKIMLQYSVLIIILLFRLLLFNLADEWVLDVVFFLHVLFVVPGLLLFLILIFISTKTGVSLFFRSINGFGCIFKPLDKELKLASLKEELENHTKHLPWTLIALINSYLWQEARHGDGHLFLLLVCLELQNFLDDISLNLT